MFLTYVNWETDQRAKNFKQGDRNPTSDPLLIRAVFERAVLCYARVAVTAEAARVAADAAGKVAEAREKRAGRKGKGKAVANDTNEKVTSHTTSLEDRRVAEETKLAYKDAEAGLWAKYAIWAVSLSGCQLI